MMPKFSDLLNASSAAHSNESAYWSNLVNIFSAFGEEFVKYLELPSPTFIWEGKPRSYVVVTQSNALGSTCVFDPKDYVRKERAIPFTIRVTLPDASRKTLREVSINLAISNIDNKPGIYSAEFTPSGRSVPYSVGSSHSLMDQISEVLKTKAATVQ
ncbi:hypothetical protein PSYJA_01174 [Pseudomonas syringae pv. japonica str. M301072]|uniref:Uncharacterized protein n=1 Tax=Pseudomonas syringae pv. japonica str. M301072 TaxID=629262 RepID=F3FBW8_PSESX|nr:hypothetical protein PSYJA_01174 [Pseudomonas syringae pv. japonica str. M301072]